MAGTGDKLLDQAIKGTEDEIFSEAFGQDGTVDNSDDAPDTSLEEMEDDDASAVADEGEEEGEESEGDDAEDDGDTEAADGSEGADKDGKRSSENRDDETGRFKAKDADKGEGDQGRGKPQRGDVSVPLRAERAKRAELEKALEDERAARKAETDRLARLEGQLDAILKGQAHARPEPKAEPKAEDQEPDIFSDPEGWKVWNKRQTDAVAQSLRQDFENRIIEQSFGVAHEKYGKDFEDAYGALTQLNPTNQTHRAIVAGIRRASNPGAELMRWHKRQTTLTAMGSDPDAYIQRRIEQLLDDPETRKKLAARLRGDGGEEGGVERRNGGQQRPVRSIIRNPRSLNSEGGRAQRTNDVVDDDGSDDAVFKSAFA